MRTAPSTALLGLLLLVGCSADPVAPAGPPEPPGPVLPAESSFAEGTCAQVAPYVIAVGGALPRLGGGGSVDPQVKLELREAQDQLFEVAAAAEPALKPTLDDLVLKIGLVRIRADGNSYETSQGAVLQTAYDATVRTCTAPPSPAPPSPAPPPSPS